MDPKYKIGQKVWAMWRNEAGEHVVEGIVRYKGSAEFFYLFKKIDGSYAFQSDAVEETKVFATKEDFIGSIK